MPILDAPIRTITCDGAGCTKTVTFDRRQEKETFETPGNEWLKATRVVQTVDGRNLSYCSDECEVKGAAEGKHNLPEPKRVIESGNAAAVAIAAQQAAAAKQAEANIRSGKPANIQITD